MDERKILNSTEIMKSAIEQIEAMRFAVIVDDGDIVFVDVDYEIPISECSTHAEIIRWTLHLEEKVWSTKELISAFIVRALEANDLEI